MEHKEPHGRGGGRNEVGAGRWDVEGSGDGRERRRGKRRSWQGEGETEVGRKEFIWKLCWCEKKCWNNFMQPWLYPCLPPSVRLW